jgi:hypothetical protein
MANIDPIEEVKKALVDFDPAAVTPIGDKLNECAYFYELLAQETNRQKFRWLFGAFLNSCYGYFEDKAKYFHYASWDFETDKPIVDKSSLDVLKKHVGAELKRKGKPSETVKTWGLSELMDKLYRYRSISTHDGGIGIMIKGENLPEDFYVGYRKSEAIPVLKFCRDVLACFDEIEKELSAQTC